eukprot:4637-Heterococcus_DN1.PRE.1
MTTRRVRCPIVLIAITRAVLQIEANTICTAAFSSAQQSQHRLLAVVCQSLMFDFFNTTSATATTSAACS